MPGEYGEQVPDPGVEGRFQDFISRGGSPGSNLRDAFAQLLAQGQPQQPVSMEDVWRAQMQQQMPQNPNPEIRNFAAETGPPNDRTPARTFEQDPRLNFPTAPAGAMAPGNAIETLNGAQPPTSPPFPGAQSVQVQPRGFNDEGLQGSGQFSLPPSLGDMVRRGRR